MRNEGIIFAIMAIFFALVTPVYWLLSYEPAGTAALALTAAPPMSALIRLLRTVHRPPAAGTPSEDRTDAEIEVRAGGRLLQPPQLVAAVPRPVRCGHRVKIAEPAVLLPWTGSPQPGDGVSVRLVAADPGARQVVLEPFLLRLSRGVQGRRRPRRRGSPPGRGWAGSERRLR